jgi:DNA-binding PadR family transcriptional regulator
MSEHFVDEKQPPSRNKKDPSEDIFKKQQLFLILWFVSEAKDGATGYELQKHVPIPRSTVYRFLNDLEIEELVASSKQEHEGRLQKRYRITAKGLEQLGEIRKAIAGNIAFMYRIAAGESGHVDIGSIGQDLRSVPEHDGRTRDSPGGSKNPRGKAGNSFGEDLVQELGDVPFLPIPPMLLGLLDYSRVQAAIDKAKDRESLLSDLEGMKGFISKVLAVHEGTLGEIKSRLALLQELCDDVSISAVNGFDEEKKRLENIISQKRAGKIEESLSD